MKCQNGGKFERFQNILKKNHVEFKSQSIFTEFLVVILTFNQINKHFRLWALRPSGRSAGDAREGMEQLNKLREKKMLAPLAWLKETDTVATHAQAKRDIAYNAGYTVHVYPI